MKTKKVLRIVFIQSLAAMLGSLYFSNFGDPLQNIMTGQLFPAEGFEPCHLCWWARIIMYPITVISGLGLLFEDKNALKYSMTLALPGILLEVYHYTLQKFDITTSQACTFDNPCAALSVDYLGFITIPFLCLVAFVVILIASWQGLKK